MQIHSFLSTFFSLLKKTPFWLDRFCPMKAWLTGVPTALEFQNYLEIWLQCLLCFNLSDHLKQIKGKCEATTQTILDIARNRQLRGREMQTILKLHLLDLPVLLSHCVAFMTDLNVGQIISNTNSLVLVQF